MKSILDSSFRYTPSFGTDLAKKFAIIRREQQKSGKTRAKVVPITQAAIGKNLISDK